MLALALGALFAMVELLDRQLYFEISPERYLVLRTLLELGSVLISFAVFIANWEASKLSNNSRSLFVSTGFLAVSALSTMHALSYPGMPDFLSRNSVEKTVLYWMASNYAAASVLLVAAFVRPDLRAPWLRRYLLAVLAILASAAVMGVVTFYEGALPQLYVEGQGLTPLKTPLEYGAVGLSLAGLAAYLRAYRATGDDFMVLLVAALVANVFSGLAFATYRSPTDLYSLLAHVYKLIAYYLIFRGLLVSSLRLPYVQLSAAKERLERTVAELDARNRELDALDDIAVVMNSTLQPRQLLESALEKVMGVMEAEAGAVFLLADDGERLGLSVWRGLPSAVVEECRVRPMRLSDGARPVTGGGVPSSLNGGGGELSLEGRIAPLGACMCASIASKGRLLGSIAVVSRQGRIFGVRDLDLLAAIGYQLGLATENAQLYEQTDERLREKVRELEQAERRSRFLSDVGALLGGAEDLCGALDRVAELCSGMLGDWCLVYLLDEKERHLWLCASHHPAEEFVAVREALRRSVVGMGEGVVGRVALSGEPVVSSLVSREEIAAEMRQMAVSVEDLALLRRITPSSRIVAPLRSRSGTVGVLVVATTGGARPLDRSDLPLVMELADRIGVAVENRRLYQESQEQRRHLETIISQMADGVVVTDEMGEVSVINASARRMLGDGIAALLGCSVDGRADLEPGTAGSGGQRAAPLVRRALAGELVLGESITVGQPSGERVLSASASPVRDDSGGITGSVVVLRDVTAEREVDRLKDEFVAVVSHELRTPITAVMGYTDILLRGLRGPLAPKQADALGSIRAAAQRLLVLINDLLDTSRLEAGKQELTLVPVDLHGATDRALMAVGVLAASKGIRLVHAVPRGLPLVLADEEQLQRILGNLLSNAIKFTPEGGTVTLSAEARPAAVGEAGRRRDLATRFVAVMVTDTGVGIPPEHQAKIWEKFHQVDSSSRRPFGGTGLGLAITKGLVELHGGTVWVESEGIPGRGSTFGFTLPVAPHRLRGMTDAGSKPDIS